MQEPKALWRRIAEPIRLGFVLGLAGFFASFLDRANALDAFAIGVTWGVAFGGSLALNAAARLTVDGKLPWTVDVWLGPLLLSWAGLTSMVGRIADSLWVGLAVASCVSAIVVCWGPAIVSRFDRRAIVPAGRPGAG